MPEGPEVETVRRTLEPLVLNKSFVKIFVSQKKLRKPISRKQLDSFLGLEIKSIQRKGKLCWLEFSKENGLFVHLGMTGNFYVALSSQAKKPHTHVCLDLSDGIHQLRFTDQRRFGYLKPFFSLDEKKEELSKIGPDALSLSKAEKESIIASIHSSVTPALFHGGKAYKEISISKDDNACGFRTLGLDRKSGADLLLEHADDKQVRALATPEIMSALVECSVNKRHNAEYVAPEYFQEILETVYRFLALEAMSADIRTASENKELLGRKGVLELLLNDQNMFENFVHSEIARSERMLGFVRDGTGFLDALAHILGTEIKVYEHQTPGDAATPLVEIHTYQPPECRSSVKILYTGERDGERFVQNHFNLLVDFDS